MKTKLALICIAGLAVAGASAGWAQGRDPTAIIHTRQAHYKEIGKAAKGVLDQLKSRSPSLPAIQPYARHIDLLAPQVSGWFPVGSGPRPGVKTSAKPDVWTRPDEFRRDTAAFVTAAPKFDDVAATGDLPAIRSQAAVLGETCKTCHQSFRTRDD